MDLHASLSDPDRYKLYIEKLHSKYALTSELYSLEQGGVSLASMAIHAKDLSRTLARTIERGNYRFSPARIEEIQVEGKTRAVFRYPLIDRIVHGTISDLIEEVTCPLLSDRLYSYRPGVSWLQPGFDLAGHVRSANVAASDPKERGLYVLRRDIHAYTDSIPVHESSSVWPKLRSALTNGNGGVKQQDWELVERVVRPVVKTEDGRLFRQERGVPTGQPISCVMFNFYLSDLDHEMAAIPGSFYARYSDDILFAHPDPRVVNEADALMEECIHESELSLNHEKNRNLYLNVAGRSDGTAWKGTSGITFVGAQVTARGTISLGRSKQRHLLREIRIRALRTARGLSGRDTNTVGRAVCEVINRVLAGDGGPFQQRSASLVRRAITNREQLAQLDYWLARIVVQAVTGDPSVRGFRKVPYSRIRDDWKLVSLLHSRNRWGR
jgi:hypothetical protein